MSITMASTKSTNVYNDAIIALSKLLKTTAILLKQLLLWYHWVGGVKWGVIIECSTAMSSFMSMTADSTAGAIAKKSTISFSAFRVATNGEVYSGNDTRLV